MPHFWILATQNFEVAKSKGILCFTCMQFCTDLLKFTKTGWILIMGIMVCMSGWFCQHCTTTNKLCPEKNIPPRRPCVGILPGSEQTNLQTSSRKCTAMLTQGQNCSFFTTTFLPWLTCTCTSWHFAFWSILAGFFKSPGVKIHYCSKIWEIILEFNTDVWLCWQLTSLQQGLSWTSFGALRTAPL